MIKTNFNLNSVGTFTGKLNSAIDAQGSKFGFFQ